MAAATIASGYPKISSMGDHMVYSWKLSAVSDTNTLATGLSGIFDYWVNWEGNPGTQASGGGHSALSGSTITFYPSTDSLEATVFVRV